MGQGIGDAIVHRYPESATKITILAVRDPMCINADLILELQGKLKGAGFRTLDFKDVDEALQECRRWVNKKISAITGWQKNWV